jgi:hypothetical protein
MKIKVLLFSLTCLAFLLLGYGKMVIDQKSEFMLRVTDPSEYGEVTFLQAGTAGSKYFNLYPLESGEILPCRHSIFKVEDRIKRNQELRIQGKVPSYVEERTRRNQSAQKIERKSSSENEKEQKDILTALGSGFVLNEKWVITNHHLIERSNVEPLLQNIEEDLAALSTHFEVKGKNLDATRMFGSYQLSELNNERALGEKVVIEGFQMQELLRIEGPLEMIDDQHMGILLNPIKGSVYWGVASGLSGSPVIEASTGKVIGVARSAGYYTNEDFPKEDERNTYIRIIDIDTLRSFVESTEK